MNMVLRGLVLFCATVVVADPFGSILLNDTWMNFTLPDLDWKPDVQAEDQRELGIQFYSRKIRSSSPVLMRWTDELRKRTIAEAREQQIALTRDHVLRRIWASTLADVHVKWPDYASKFAQEAIKDELRNHGIAYREIGNGLTVEVGAPQ